MSDTREFFKKSFENAVVLLTARLLQEGFTEQDYMKKLDLNTSGKNTDRYKNYFMDKDLNNSCKVYELNMTENFIFDTIQILIFPEIRLFMLYGIKRDVPYFITSLNGVSFPRLVTKIERDNMLVTVVLVSIINENVLSYICKIHNYSFMLFEELEKNKQYLI